MNSDIEERICMLLENWFHYDSNDCGTILACMRSQARMAGFELNGRFAAAGLGAGPEARVASRIVKRALLGGGDETSDYSIETQVREWVLRNPMKGRR